MEKLIETLREECKQLTHPVDRSIVKQGLADLVDHARQLRIIRKRRVKRMEG